MVQTTTFVCERGCFVSEVFSAVATKESVLIRVNESIDHNRLVRQQLHDALASRMPVVSVSLHLTLSLRVCKPVI